MAFVLVCNLWSFIYPWSSIQIVPEVKELRAKNQFSETEKGHNSVINLQISLIHNPMLLIPNTNILGIKNEIHEEIL